MDPILAKPYTDRDDPRRAKDRTLIPLPTDKKSKTEQHEPKRTAPYTLILDPSLT